MTMTIRYCDRCKREHGQWDYDDHTATGDTPDSEACPDCVALVAVNTALTVENLRMRARLTEILAITAEMTTYADELQRVMDLQDKTITTLTRHLTEARGEEPR